MEFGMIDTIYATLPKRVQIENMTFSCKDISRKAIHIYWRGGKEIGFQLNESIIDK